MGETTNICILGAGPAGLRAAALLRHQGDGITVVGRRLYGMLAPVQFEGAWFTPLPVFTVPGRGAAGSDRDRGSRPPVTIDYHEEESAVAPPVARTGPGSFARFLGGFHADPRVPMTLSQKHFGDIIHSEALPLARKKVMDKYTTGRNKDEAIGFTAGFSPVYRRYRDTSALRIRVEGCVRIDPERRRLHTHSGWIDYARLVVTLPLPRLVHGLPPQHQLEFNLIGRGASFLQYHLPTPQVPNRLIYDCRPDSPIYRVFTPLSRVATVHLASRPGRPDWSAVTRRLQIVLGLSEAPRCVHRRHHALCYPLGISDPSSLARYRIRLAGLGIHLSGRLAEWRYCDLDEADLDLGGPLGMHGGCCAGSSLPG